MAICSFCSYLVFAQGEKQHSRKMHVAAARERLICALHCKTHSFLRKEKK